MKKVIKIRFYPNQSQINIINETLGCCRYIKNMYIEYNKMIYEKEGNFISGYDFSKIINKLKKKESKYEWMNHYSSKAIKDAIMDEEKAFKRFFKKKQKYPKFKSRKSLNKESFFFIKDNIKFDIDNKYIIKIPILGKIRTMQKHQLPDISYITSGRVIKEYDKYYVMFIYNFYPDQYNIKNNIKIGIDVGIKKYATIYIDNGDIIMIPHFKDNDKYKQISQKIIYFHQLISFKAEINYNRLLNAFIDKNFKEPNEFDKKIMRGKNYKSSHIRCIIKKIHRLYEKLNNIRRDFINKFVYYIVVRIKPQIITIEDLSIKNILQKNGDKKMHNYIHDSAFYYFKQHLINKCEEYNVELHLADRFYASSKICSCCGKKKNDITLKDRDFICDYCGYQEDRDVNAAINLCNLKKKNYKVIV